MGRVPASPRAAHRRTRRGAAGRARHAAGVVRRALPARVGTERATTAHGARRARAPLAEWHQSARGPARDRGAGDTGARPGRPPGHRRRAHAGGLGAAPRGARYARRRDPASLSRPPVHSGRPRVGGAVAATRHDLGRGRSGGGCAAARRDTPWGRAAGERREGRAGEPAIPCTRRARWLTCAIARVGGRSRVCLSPHKTRNSKFRAGLSDA